MIRLIGSAGSLPKHFGKITAANNYHRIWVIYNKCFSKKCFEKIIIMRKGREHPENAKNVVYDVHKPAAGENFWGLKKFAKKALFARLRASEVGFPKKWDGNRTSICVRPYVHSLSFIFLSQSDAVMHCISPSNISSSDDPFSSDSRTWCSYRPVFFLTHLAQTWTLGKKFTQISEVG